MQNIVEKNVETISYLKLVEDEGYNPMSQEQIPFFILVIFIWNIILIEIG